VLVIERAGYKIVVWLDELPSQANAGTNVLSDMVISTGHIKFNLSRVAIEFFCNAHASNYGLLGFEFLPNNNVDKIEITVNYSDSPVFNPKATERIIEGIDAEFSNAILHEAKKQFEMKNTIPLGKLTFCSGKTKYSGSSIRRFQFLTKMLIDILYCKDGISEQKIVDLVGEAERYIKNL
jgi:hypothetical protein